MRNISVLGSCDEAVRQAEGLVLELWGELIGGGVEGVFEGKKGYGVLMLLKYTIHCEKVHKTMKGRHVKDQILFLTSL